MKSLLLSLIICLISTLFVFGQTYKASDGTLLIKTSTTTWTLKFEHSYGSIYFPIFNGSTFYLFPNMGKEDIEDIIFGISEPNLYDIPFSSYYVKINQKQSSSVVTLEYFDNLGTKLWTTFLSQKY